MFKFVIVGLISLFGAIAQAEPQVEPGPVQPVEGGGLAAMTVLGALIQNDNEDVKAFLAAGETFTSAAVQQLSPGTTRYTFTIRKVRIEPRLGVGKKVYLGGASLMVTHESLGEEKYETRLSLIKSTRR